MSNRLDMVRKKRKLTHVLVELVGLGLDGGQEGRHLLLGLDQQVLQVGEHGLLHLVVDHGGGHAGAHATTRSTDSI